MNRNRIALSSWPTSAYPHLHLSFEAEKKKATRFRVAYDNSLCVMVCWRRQHLLTHFGIMSFFSRCCWQCNLKQLPNRLHVVHVQALQLLRCQVFLHILPVVFGQDDVLNSRALGRQGFFLAPAGT
jgi:hypothetical protein